MASFKCSGCGRTDFFTSHGFAKHGRKCNGKRETSVNSRKWAEDVKRRGFSGASAANMGGAVPGRHLAAGAFRVPAWEKLRVPDRDSAGIDPNGAVVSSGRWVIYAYASDYNSRQNSKGGAYSFAGSGRLTGRDLLMHADKIIAHANRQDAERFFEFYKVVPRADGTTLIVLLFGS